MSKKLKLLIVEDEEPIRNGLVDLFVYHGYEVDTAADGETGLDMARSGEYALIVLDVMLPKKDGFTVCNEIRAFDREQPIVMLTAKATEEDIITGLSHGADDYLTKPFSVRELVLRVESVLRRSRKVRESQAELVLGSGLRIDIANLTGSPTNGGDEVPFTRREVEILQYLQDNETRPVSRDELLTEVWGYAKAATIETRTVDIHIAKLRRKIESDPKNPQWLITMRGEGYKLISSG